YPKSVLVIFFLSYVLRLRSIIYKKHLFHHWLFDFQTKDLTSNFKTPKPKLIMNLKSFSIVALLIGGVAVPAFSQQKDIKLPPEATEFWEPEPRVVTPGASSHLPPSDAIVLFDGTNLDQWKGQRDGGAAPWKIEDGAFTVVPRTGGIESKESFGDAQIHLEWRSPSVVKGESQGRGNSGFFLMGKYEIQILDSYENRSEE